MSWDQLFNNMIKNTRRVKKSGKNYYVFHPNNDMIGGASIKYISPTTAEVARARSEMKNNMIKKIKKSRVVIVKGSNTSNKKRVTKKTTKKHKKKEKKKVKIRQNNKGRKLGKKKIKKVIKLKKKIAKKKKKSNKKKYK